MKNFQVQVAVRPIQLYEVVFPEEHKDVMLSTILGDSKGKTQHKKHNKFIYALRKILGVEEIPNFKTDLKMPISNMNTEIIGIGIKKDYWQHSKTGEKADHKVNDEYFEAL